MHLSSNPSQTAPWKRRGYLYCVQNLKHLEDPLPRDLQRVALVPLLGGGESAVTSALP